MNSTRPNRASHKNIGRIYNVNQNCTNINNSPTEVLQRTLSSGLLDDQEATQTRLSNKVARQELLCDVVFIGTTPTHVVYFCAERYHNGTANNYRTVSYSRNPPSSRIIPFKNMSNFVSGNMHVVGIGTSKPRKLL